MRTETTYHFGEARTAIRFIDRRLQFDYPTLSPKCKAVSQNEKIICIPEIPDLVSFQCLNRGMRFTGYVPGESFPEECREGLEPLVGRDGKEVLM